MKLTPLTTRPAATSRQGMMRLARPMDERCEFFARGGRIRPALFALLPLFALGGLERSLEIEGALVERASGNGAEDAFAFEARELLDVLQAVDSAAGDHRDPELARQLGGSFDIDAGEHAVASDIGVDQRFDAVVLELFGQIDHVVPGHLRPAVRRHLAFTRIESDDDVPGKCIARVVQKTRILHRGSADDHERDAVVEIALDGVEIAYPTAQLYRDLLADNAHDLADRHLIFGFAGKRTVEIDKVQPFGAEIEPMAGHRGRILGKYGRGLHLPLLQADAVTVLDIDCGNDLHVGGCATASDATVGNARIESDAAVPGDEIGEQLETGAVALLGMELHGKDISACNRASKRRRVFDRRGGQPRIIRHRVIAVRKVESCVILDATPQGMVLLLSHGAPTHVRNLEAVPGRIVHSLIAKSNDITREDAKTRSGSFLAVIEQHLQTEADAQEWAVAGHFHDDFPQAAVVEGSHAVGHRALTRQHHTLRAAYCRRIGAHHDGALGRDVQQRLGDRAQVARSVVDNGDVEHQGSESELRKEKQHSSYWPRCSGG